MCKIKTLSFSLYPCKSYKNVMPRGLVLGMCKMCKMCKNKQKEKQGGLLHAKKL